jgi:hypothetical protein
VHCAEHGRRESVRTNREHSQAGSTNGLSSFTFNACRSGEAVGNQVSGRASTFLPQLEEQQQAARRRHSCGTCLVRHDA